MPPPDDRSTAALVIAIDGPSGSGKSTVSREVASRLGLRYLDTGSMYRAITWWALEKGLDIDDTDAIARLVHEADLDVGTDPAGPTVSVAGVDVTQAVRATRISEAVSMVATNLAVRKELVRRQQAIVAEGGVVVEGRDITTVVAPEAHVRVLLTATPDTRVARRAHDVHGRADGTTISATRDEVLRRDSDDSTVAEFHEPAEGVVVLDSSSLSLDETVDRVLGLVREYRSEVLG